MIRIAPGILDGRSSACEAATVIQRRDKWWTFA
jgi:hypothetical protein